MGSESRSHLSFKKKLICITGCFRKTNHPHDNSDQPLSPTTPAADKTNQSPRVGIIKTKSPRLNRTLSKSQEKCRTLINKIGGGGGGGATGQGKHVRRHTTDFHYDPSSYALNFDRGDEEDNVGGRFPLRNFSARLPRSPPSSSSATAADSSSFTIHNLLR